MIHSVDATPSHILGDDYITPHRTIIENPKPIQIIRILPGVVFEFRFILKIFEADGYKVTTQMKSNLFSELIQILGVGAKTNVGYGEMLPYTLPKASTPTVELPTVDDVGKIFTARIVAVKDKKNYKLEVYHNDSTFSGIIKKDLIPGVALKEEIQVKLEEITEKSYKFTLPS